MSWSIEIILRIKKPTTHFKPKMDKNNISESVKHQAKYEVKNTDKEHSKPKKKFGFGNQTYINHY